MRKFSLNIGGRMIEYAKPAVMGILNVTPDSFFSGSRATSIDAVKTRVENMLAEGVDIIDIGAMSTRPGGFSDVDAAEELRRLEFGMEAIRAVAPDVPVSVDTFRSDVARIAVEKLSANIINDISGGNADNRMFETIADLQVPYVVMHAQGAPDKMHEATAYDNLLVDMLTDFAAKVSELSLLGVNDVIIDPGFGFSKTLEQNYLILKNLDLFEIFQLPILVGVSRKSMITKLLDIDASDSLIGTTALNMRALERGASILRVHDVAAAVQAVKIYMQF